jgi:hypothetical protein
MKKIILLFMIGLAVSLSAQAQKTKTKVKTKKTVVKVAELPKAITENIATDYAGYKILKANKCDDGGVISYQVSTSKGSSNVDLYYDKDGKYLKKAFLPSKATTSKSSKSKGTTKKTDSQK